MTKGRLEAFSDGVIAIIITIMVLSLRVPHGDREQDLLPLVPTFLSYVLSFVYVGIYWNNHHHLLHATKKVKGSMLWANLHLLFWLSLFPFMTGWVGTTGFAPHPTALYGMVLMMAGIAYYILERCIISVEGANSVLGRAVGQDRKGILSIFCYATAVPFAFFAYWIAVGLYVLVALIWLIPDRRIEKALASME
jgi:uncharacterized membrane protein